MCVPSTSKQSHILKMKNEEAKDRTNRREERRTGGKGGREMGEME